MVRLRVLNKNNKKANPVAQVNKFNHQRPNTKGGTYAAYISVGIFIFQLGPARKMVIYTSENNPKRNLDKQ